MYLARVAAVNGGLPVETPALTVNRLCGSGLQAIVSAAQAILLGDCDVAVAGGAECDEPRAVLAARHALGPAHGRRRRGRRDGRRADRSVRRLPHGRDRGEHRRQVRRIAREDQDALARRKPPARRRGHRKRATSTSQIVPVEVTARKGTTMFDTDEHVRPDAQPRTTLAKLQAGLQPGRHGDGGQRFRHQRCRRRGGADGGRAGAEQRACSRWRAWSPTPRRRRAAVMGMGPVPAVRSGTRQSGPQARRHGRVRSQRGLRRAGAGRRPASLGLSAERTNPNGSGVALGHPIGATGAILTVKALYELQRTGGATRWSPCASAAGRASRRSSSGSEPSIGVAHSPSR